MSSYTVAALIATICLLQTPYCDCNFDIESLFGETPAHEQYSNNHKSLLSSIEHLFHGRNTNPVSEGYLDGSNTGELKTSGKGTSLAELGEGPQKGSGIPNANSQPTQGIKLSDVFGLKSVLDKLQNRKSSSRGTHEHAITDRTNNNDEKNELTDYVHNYEPPVDNDISVIVVEEQLTTQTTTPPPIVTIDTEVITTKANFENCMRNKKCNLFNIQGLLSKIFNSDSDSTQEPATTQQPHDEKSQLFPLINFNHLFRKAGPASPAPVVDEDAEANTNNNIFGGCGKKKGDSPRNCGRTLFNISGILSQILNGKPFDDAPQKDTGSVDSQIFQNFPAQISNIIPKLDFQEFLPAITKLFPDFHKSQNEQKQNGHLPNPFIEKSLDTVSDLLSGHQQQHNELKKDGNKPNSFPKSFEDITSLLQNFNMIK